MQDKILEVLRRNGPLKTKDLTQLVGKQKVKEIQSILNKLLNRNDIQKTKVNGYCEWSVTEIVEEGIGIVGEQQKYETREKDTVVTHQVLSKNTAECTRLSMSNVNNNNESTSHVSTGTDTNTNFNGLSPIAIEIINSNLKEEVVLLRKEIDVKNELVNSLQKIINMLMTDQQQLKQQMQQQQEAKEQNNLQQQQLEEIKQQHELLYRQTLQQQELQQEQQLLQQQQNQRIQKQQQQQQFENLQIQGREQILPYLQKKINHQQNQPEVLESDMLDGDSSDDSSEIEDIQYIQTAKIKSPLRRPTVVTTKQPEKQHFTNNNNNRNRSKELPTKEKKPFIMMIGDSMSKDISSYELKQNVKTANFMIRSLRGGKLKNIKNLMIDALEDIDNKPDAICIHVSTNDIGAGRDIDNIVEDFENLIILIKRQGIEPLISLLTVRNDKYGHKVKIMNERLEDLCLRYNVSYVDHSNIRNEHLNQGGIHISNQFKHLFTDNLYKYFTYIVQNHSYFQ